MLICEHNLAVCGLILDVGQPQSSREGTPRLPGSGYIQMRMIVRPFHWKTMTKILRRVMGATSLLFDLDSGVRKHSLSRTSSENFWPEGGRIELLILSRIPGL
jgi:hypothetical protein